MGLRKYSNEVVKEAKRVRWPKPDVLFPTIVVVLVIVFFASSTLIITIFFTLQYPFLSL
jgi:preprotein translocase SecE subunit